MRWMLQRLIQRRNFTKRPLQILAVIIASSVFATVASAQFTNFAFWGRIFGLGSFAITGVKGGTDTTADEWLTNGSDPTIVFAASSSATSYDVVIKNAADTSVICQSLGATSTSVAVSSCALVNGTSYKVHVTAKLSAQTKVASNDSFTITVDTTAPTANTITGITGGSDTTADAWLVGGLVPTVKWTAFTNASSYDVTIRNSVNTADVCSLQNTTSTSFNFSSCTLVDGTSYRAYVTAKSISGLNTTSASNTGYSFTVDNVTPGAFSISGITGGTDSVVDNSLTNGSDPTVTFTTASNVYRYDVVIKDSTGTTTVCSALNQAVSPVSVSSCSLTNGTSYKVYVTAKSISTQLTTAASNDGYTFTVNTSAGGSSPLAFSITGATSAFWDSTPDNILSDGLVVTANWQKSAGATSYDVTIRNSSDTADVCSVQNTTALNYAFTGCTLVKNTVYKIKVVAKNASGTLTAMNSPYPFQVIPGAPMAFKILGVSSGVDTFVDQYLTDGLLPTVNWQYAGADSYDVTIRNATNTADVCATVNTTQTYYAFSSCTLTANTSYLVTVSAKNADQIVVALNNLFEFYVAATTTFCPTGSSTAKALTIYDSGGAASNYSSGQNCNFTINPAVAADDIGLDFVTFASNDTSDILTVYDGLNTSGSLLGSFKATTTAPYDVTAASGTMYLTWVSNNNGQAAGYRLNFRALYSTVGSFSIAGAKGGTDTTADNQLTDNSSGVTVDWSASSSAKKYVVAVRDSKDSIDICSRVTTTAVTYAFTGCSLVKGMQYAITVYAMDGNGDVTAASNNKYLFIYDDRPAPFNVLGISGGSDYTLDNTLTSGLEPKVTWSTSAGASSYDVVIYENDGTTVKCALSNVTSPTTTKTFTGCSLTLNSYYEAEVIAKNANGNTGATNNRYQFQVLPVQWTPLSYANITVRYEHVAVWTGSEMIVWGGSGPGGFDLNEGAKYNPTTDSWTALSYTNAPDPRYLAKAIWTGTEMIVWGGFSSSLGMALDSGGRYNPSTNTWVATPVTASTASSRYAHTMAWSGTEMLVWGGEDPYLGKLGNGSKYNPSTNTWTAMDNSAAPGVRANHTAVWTGSRMLVWGGYNASTSLNSGGSYNPTTNTWTTLTFGSDVPEARKNHTAVWTGTEMIVWGGVGTAGTRINTGGKYNPSTNTWTATSISGSVPQGRELHTAIWTGSDMIVWGGETGVRYTTYQYKNDGGKYNPSTDTWTATSMGTNLPTQRESHTAVWTGSLMLIWGGSSPSLLDDGASYAP